MSKLRIMMEIDSAGMRDVLTTSSQRDMLGASIVNTLLAGKKGFGDAVTLGFYGIKIISMNPVADSAAVMPTPKRGWLVLAAMREWVR